MYDIHVVELMYSRTDIIRYLFLIGGNVGAEWEEIDLHLNQHITKRTISVVVFVNLVRFCISSEKDLLLEYHCLAANTAFFTSMKLIFKFAPYFYFTQCF